MKNSIPKIIDKLSKMNTGYQIKICARKMQNGLYSLYLDYSYKSSRQRKSLGLYVAGDSRSKIKDENEINKAKLIRDKKEKEIYESNSGIKLFSEDNDKNFMEFFEETAQQKQDYNYTVSFNYFNEFINKGYLLFSELTRDICLKYKDYLLKLSVKAHTAHHYFVTFKAVINLAVLSELIDRNPANGISIKYDDPKIEFLTITEVKELIEKPCKFPQIKNGFLFSTFSGLRRSDLNKISFKDIKEKHLYFRQKKTRETVRIKLNTIALGIIKEQKKVMKRDRIFSIPTGGRLTQRFREWINSESINQKITFHCSRHTFGTLLVTKGENIYTIMKLMGHKNIKTTMKYLHLVDSRKDKAIDLLDEYFE
jgi:integrase